MTIPDGASISGSDDGWKAVRTDSSIQYEPVQPPETPKPEVPEWLQNLGDSLSDFFSPLGNLLGGSWPILKWVLLALAVAAILYILYRLVEPYLEKSGSSAAAEEEAWAPAAEEALALLSDADQLASEGRYDEATHLLLKRSVGQIADARPDLVEPSSTARELAMLPALPDNARMAFGVISERVERSLFALRALGADDWQAARDAYAEFALARLPARTAGYTAGFRA